MLRISATGDRTEKDYLAETEFVHYLAQNGAPVADAIPSVNGKLVELVEAAGDVACDGGTSPVFISLFEYAKGMLLCDNGYRYRDGVPLEEYFFNTGKTLGKIHALAKCYEPAADSRRPDYFDKYNMDYIKKLIPDTPAIYKDLKKAIDARLEKFRGLPTDTQSYGLIHFDFSDGNYHIDMTTGDITVFDFDNCLYCWYMFDLANLYLHGEGWARHISESKERQAYMQHYFDTILQGYKTETTLDETLCKQFPLFIDMVLIENIVDEFECAAREGEEIDFEDVREAAESLMENGGK